MAIQLSQKAVGLAVLGITIIFVATAVSTLGLLTNTKTVRNVGAVKTVNVDVYWDSGCTDAVTAIDWGIVEPGSANDISFYVRNEGNLPLTLGLSTQNWNPTVASSYISLGWNRERRVLAAGDVTLATLTLSVSSGISDVSDFSFDIVISGTEQ